MNKTDVIAVSWNWSDTGCDPWEQGHISFLFLAVLSEPLQGDAERGGLLEPRRKRSKVRAAGPGIHGSETGGGGSTRSQAQGLSAVSGPGLRAGHTGDSRRKPSRELLWGWKLPGDPRSKAELWVAGHPACLQPEWTGPAKHLGCPAGLQKGSQWEDNVAAEDSGPGTV